jgi:sec-independent protein translocase protein TatA
MGSMSIWHWLIVLVIVLLVFGSGKVTNIMGDVAKGIKAFKKGMKDDEEEQRSKPGVIEGQSVAKEKDREHVG